MARRWLQFSLWTVIALTLTVSVWSYLWKESAIGLFWFCSIYIIPFFIISGCAAVCRELFIRRKQAALEGKQVIPWSQYSLMTAFVTMLTASGLLFINFYSPFAILAADPEPVWEIYGYPWPALQLERGRIELVSFEALLIDAIINISCLILVAIICEYYIRHQDRKRQAKQEGGK